MAIDSTRTLKLAIDSARTLNVIFSHMYSRPDEYIDVMSWPVLTSASSQLRTYIIYKTFTVSFLGFQEGRWERAKVGKDATEWGVRQTV